MAEAPPTFLIARNPDDESSLPYLLRLPIDGGVELKARERWPVTARVYCHPLDEGWPAKAEVVEEVRSAVAPGAGRRSTSFWTAATTTARSSSLRSPGYRFSGRNVERRKRTLNVGDYAVLGPDDSVVAVVERKTFEDFTTSVVDGSLVFQLLELAGLPHAAVVVEERYGAMLKAPHVQPGWLCEAVARLQVRYPAVPIVFADSRKLAEDYTYRFLGTALDHHATGAGDGVR